MPYINQSKPKLNCIIVTLNQKKPLVNRVMVIIMIIIQSLYGVQNRITCVYLNLPYSTKRQHCKMIEDEWSWFLAVFDSKPKELIHFWMKTEVEIKIRAIQSAKVSPFANLLNKLQNIWQSMIPSIKCRIDWLKYNY